MTDNQFRPPEPPHGQQPYYGVPGGPAPQPQGGGSNKTVVIIAAVAAVIVVAIVAIVGVVLISRNDSPAAGSAPIASTGASASSTSRSGDSDIPSEFKLHGTIKTTTAACSVVVAGSIAVPALKPPYNYDLPETSAHIAKARLEMQRVASRVSADAQQPAGSDIQDFVSAYYRYIVAMESKNAAEAQSWSSVTAQIAGSLRRSCGR